MQRVTFDFETTRNTITGREFQQQLAEKWPSRHTTFAEFLKPTAGRVKNHHSWEMWNLHNFIAR